MTLDRGALEHFLTGPLPSPEELTAIVAALSDERKAVQRRAAEVLVALDRRGLAVRTALEALLEGPIVRGRWGAAFTLGQLGVLTGAVLDGLFDTLGDPDGDLRWAAAELLTRAPAAEGVERRLAAALAAGTGSQRKMALYCLRDLAGWAADREALVLAALGDPDPSVRLAAMTTLARRAADRGAAAAAVAALLEDGDPGVQRAAAATLGHLGCDTPSIRERLAQAAARPDAALARAATGALCRLGSGR